MNAAIAAGRMDLVRDLADECQDEALEMILEAEEESGRRRHQPTVEVLEVGGWPLWRVRRLLRCGAGAEIRLNDRVSSLNLLGQNP